MSTSDDCPIDIGRIYSGDVLARILRTRLTRVEAVLAAGVLVLGLGEVWVPFSSRQGTGSATATTVGVVLVAALMLVSRREPLVVLIAFPVIWLVVGVIASSYVLFYGQAVPLEIGVFMAARFGRGRAPLYAALIAGASLLGVDLLVPAMQEANEIVFHWAVTALVWSAGFGLRTLDRREKASIRRAVEAEVGAAERAMRAVLDERAVIARELHDIVGHAVSSMVVQAGAAEAGADDPDYVRETAASIRSTGIDALGEMRRLVSMLRTADEAPLSPQPRLEALPALIEKTSAQGVQAALTVTGTPRPLPAGLDLVVYRIVQEALTNVRRHAVARRCDVSLDYGPYCVSVAVVDDGSTASSGPPASGHGLVGMRERVALYGGELAAGPGQAGGFAVRATLPVPQ
ncbi:sensor histidine kinase [Cumulibacter manganitolerans]|uniref:sensor histidine kinase n=1 Tax=Cumulibacter manganitolerans TaxID=1884992 RepID=UPI0012976931|nr:sensor histidine kinase [Cumulibacter manganitolerans]